MDGLLILDKPAGWTSHDVVAKVRHLVKEKQIGHLGTLDPMATGLLPLALGAATRLIEFAGHEKEYVAACLLGQTTDSEDVTGKVLSEASTGHLEEGAVREAVLNLRRLTEQIPPMVSAIKKDGQKLYELARAGKSVEREPRAISIREIEILEVKLPRVVFRVACSGGTYVRSLCREVGERLGVGGCLESLRRTRSGLFSLNNALTLEELKKSLEAGTLAALLLAPGLLAGGLPEVVLEEAPLKAFCQGRAVEIDPLKNAVVSAGPSVFYRVSNPQGRLCAIAEISNEGRLLKPRKVFGVSGI
jgi:tRNA pseudouridine55 synthase